MPSIELTLKCAKCGSQKFEQPDNPKPHDKITCSRCGAIGRHSEVQKASIEAMKKEISRSLGKAFKKF
ncbi:ECs_2282 family putative zinc-binding protein [Alteromonas pelagimontana]